MEHFSERAHTDAHEWQPTVSEREEFQFDVSKYNDEERRILLLLDLAACAPKGGSAETWGATPTDIQSSLSSQAKLIHTFARRFTVPHNLQDTSPVISEYMQSSFLERFVSRCVANDEKYRRSLSPTPFDEEGDIMAEQRRVEERVASGTASIAEILAIQSIRSIGAIEIGSLTHPYGANIEYIESMRKSAENTIKLFGGEVFEDPEDVYSISDVINVDASALTGESAEIYKRLTTREKLQRRHEYGGTAGLLMTRKRTIGELPDGTKVRQRTSFILTEKSGLIDEGKLNTYASTEVCEHWGREAINSVDGVSEMIKLYLNTDSYKNVIPVSTTMYAFNEELVDRIDAAYKEANGTSSLISGGNYIHDMLRETAARQLFSAGMSGMAYSPAVQDKYVEVNGMPFFGEFPVELDIQVRPEATITEIIDTVEKEL